MRDDATPLDPTLTEAAPADELSPDASDLAGDSSMVRINHDEWSSICADLERWLSQQFGRRG